jgi:ligand-binding SRPBCC domain-containing protein
MLTKKWIFVKRNKQLNNLPPPSKTKVTVGKDWKLRDITEMAMFLEALGIPL